MSKSDDKKLEALARKNAAKAAKEKPTKRHRYDDTLGRDTEDADAEASSLFREMKKREF
jgi:hypothetical protein